jgi:hypothetical protein
MYRQIAVCLAMIPLGIVLLWLGMQFDAAVLAFAGVFAISFGALGIPYAVILGARDGLRQGLRDWATRPRKPTH